MWLLAEKTRRRGDRRSKKVRAVSRIIIDRAADSRDDPRDDDIRYIDNPDLETMAPEVSVEEAQYDELCDLYGQGIVDYTLRCFYLRSWKSLHGDYPFKLNYLRMRSLLALEQEFGLRQAYDAWKMRQEHDQQKAQIQSIPKPSMGRRF